MIRSVRITRLATTILLAAAVTCVATPARSQPAGNTAIEWNVDASSARQIVGGGAFTFLMKV